MITIGVVGDGCFEAQSVGHAVGFLTAKGLFGKPFFVHSGGLDHGEWVLFDGRYRKVEQ